MSDQLRESLSALMDDETNELELQRVLSQIGSDEELRQTWSRYQAVRTVLAGQDAAFIQLDVSRQVSAAIAGEGSSGQRTASFKQRLLRPVASFAVAASVAATVVLGGQQLAQIGSTEPFSGANSFAAGGVSPVGMVNSIGATPVRASYGTRSIPVLQPATRTAYTELARQRMEMYVQEHAEHAALNSPHGLIPFARVPEIRE